jgi:phospholipase/lecithinase/hemolysin
MPLSAIGASMKNSLMMSHSICPQIGGRVRKAAIATSLPILLVSLSSTAATAASFTNLYVFGDSLSDTGNLFRTTGNFIPPQPFYFNGRFSNGPVWVEYLAPKLGLTYNPANNFAFGSANTDTTNTFPFRVGFPGLQQEIQAFRTSSPIADPNALYVVWAGANDYLGGGVTNPAQPVANIATAITSLVQSGAKTILVPNLPDLGKLPGTRTDPQTSAGLSALSLGHNTLLAQTLSVLSGTFPNTSLIPLDVNGTLNTVLANPAQFGFTNTTDSCVFPSPLPIPRGIPSVCANPNQFVFWDDIHPTTTAHAILGDLAFNTVSNSTAVPEPATTVGMVLVGALFGAAKRKVKVKR